MMTAPVRYSGGPVVASPAFLQLLEKLRAEHEQALRNLQAELTRKTIKSESDRSILKPAVAIWESGSSEVNRKPVLHYESERHSLHSGVVGATSADCIAEVDSSPFEEGFSITSASAAVQDFEQFGAQYTTSDAQARGSSDGKRRARVSTCSNTSSYVSAPRRALDTLHRIQQAYHSEDGDISAQVDFLQSLNSHIKKDRRRNEDGPPRKAIIMNKAHSSEALAMEVSRVATIRKERHRERVRATISEATIQTKSLPLYGKTMSMLARVRKSRTFEHACGCAILFNCVVLGMYAQFTAQNHSYLDNPPLFLDIAEKACSLWFITECLIRLSAGCRDFFCGAGRYWNIFDLTVVTLDIADYAMRMAFADGEGDGDKDKGASKDDAELAPGGERSPVRNLAVLRILRVFRVMRILRLLKFSQDLQIMLRSIRQCGKSLLWALILVFLLIYLFAMYFMQNVTDFQFVSPNSAVSAQLEERWGSIFVAFYTLFMVMSGGISWIEVAEPLIHVGWVHAIALCFYVFFTLFVVTNIITSIFVDTAIQNTTDDREAVIAHKLQERDATLHQMIAIFEEAEDADGSGLISLEQFHKRLRLPRVRAYLRSVDLDVHAAGSLFELLDTDGSGAISIEEFVFGCMRLKGAARSVDLAVLMHDSKLLHDKLEELLLLQRQQSEDLKVLQEIMIFINGVNKNRMSNGLSSQIVTPIWSSFSENAQQHTPDNIPQRHSEHSQRHSSEHRQPQPLRSIHSSGESVIAAEREASVPQQLKLHTLFAL